MTDQNSVAEERVVESDTTQVASPAIEEPTTGDQTTQIENVDQGSISEGTDGLPEDTEEQRRAFQQMRLENKRLKEQVAARSGESAFNVFKPQPLPISQPEPLRIENYQDPVTGETNWQAFNQAQVQREQQVINHARTVAQQTVEESLDEQNARLKYPEVMNDQETEQEIADRWFAAKMRGENPTISQIAERVAKRYGKTVSKAEKIGQERALNEISEKEKAGLSVSGQTSEPARQVASAEENARLSFKTRKGDADAVASRISKIPWANK